MSFRPDRSSSIDQRRSYGLLKPRGRCAGLLPHTPIRDHGRLSPKIYTPRLREASHVRATLIPCDQWFAPTLSVWCGTAVGYTARSNARLAPHPCCCDVKPLSSALSLSPCALASCVGRGSSLDRRAESVIIRRTGETRIRCAHLILPLLFAYSICDGGRRGFSAATAPGTDVLRVPEHIRIRSRGGGPRATLRPAARH